MVYKGQELLGVNCGVPPTSVIACRNFQLGEKAYNQDINDILEDLKKIDSGFETHKFVRLMASLGTPRQLSRTLKKESLGQDTI